MASWLRALAATLALMALAQVGGLTDQANRWLTDAHWRARASRQPVPFPGEILVVAVDDRTIDRMGRLRYWSRRRYAELLSRLERAKTVGFDIVLSDPDAIDREGDAALALAIRRHGRVVIPFHQWTEVRTLSTRSQAELQALLRRLPQARPAAMDALPRLRPEVLQPPVPALLDAAAAVGYVDVNADPDGVYREPVLLKVTEDGRLAPHFSLAVASISQGEKPDDAVQDAPGRLLFGVRDVPLFGGAVLLRPVARRGGGYSAGLGSPVPTISFIDALEKEPAFFDGKIVLIGETAAGTTDVRGGVLDRGLRGVELNAEILANLLYLPPVTPFPEAVHWLMVFVAIGVPLRLYSIVSPRWAAVGTGVALAIPVGLMEFGFWTAGTVPSWSHVLLGSLSATGFMLVQRAVQEEAQKRQIRQRFSLYVAPEVVEEIVENPRMAAVKAERRRVAVLFSDVRGFTPYSERNPPELVTRQMQEYLTDMGEAVHAQRGVLDKFIGDAVMALWGPYLEEGVNLSARALACALEMLDRLDRINGRWEAEGLPLFRIGIGIHVGEAIVGDIQTPHRNQYTALGDSVNLAARLESATKELKAEILVSEDVRQEAEPLLGSLAGFTLLHFIDRGLIAVKGREQPVRVYEVRRSIAGGGEGERIHAAEEAGAQPAAN